MKKIITILCLIPTIGMATPNVVMTPNSIAATTPISFSASSYFMIVIPNNSNETKHYSYLASICPERQTCLTKEKTFNVAPNTTYDERFQLSTNVSYRRGGYLKNVAAIRIDGSEVLNKQTNGYFDLR